MRFTERMVALLEEITNIGNIIVASDYNEAYRLLQDENPDLVLLDINLPGKNGIEILRKLRLSGSECRVIMLTNHADEYYRQQCRELGADHFLDKSNDFAKVPDIVSRLVNERNQLLFEPSN